MTLLLLTFSVVWSCSSVLCFSTESTTTPIECNEPVITRCECGDSGNYQDFYVTSCLDIKENNSSYCGPCPGSCLIFMFCKTCSKKGCLSCAMGRRGQFCEITETTETNNLNYTEAPADKIKFYTQEIINKQETVNDSKLKSEDTIDDLNQKSADAISTKNLSHEKLAMNWKHKSKLGRNKNYRNKTAVIDEANFTVINRNVSKSNNGSNRSKIYYKDMFHSNVNPEVSLSYSNKTEKHISIQNPKETLKIPHDKFTVNHNDGFLIPSMKYENETDINDKFIDTNYSFIYTVDYINPLVSDVRNSPFKHNNFSKNRYLKEGKLGANTNERLNNSSKQWRFPFESPELHGTENLEKYEKVNSSSRLWRFPFESLKEKEKANLEENKKLNSSFSEWIFPFEQASNQSKNLKTKPMIYRQSFVFGKSDFKAEDVSHGPTNKQSNSSEMLSESSKIPSPLNISIFKIKIFETEEDVNNGNAQYLNGSRNQFDTDKNAKTLNTPEDQISNISKNSSKELTPLSPLEINVFELTFLGEENDNSFNKKTSNVTEGIIIKNAENTNISKNKTLELPENTAKESEAASGLNVSVFQITLFKNENSSSFNKKNSNLSESIIIENGEKANDSQTSKNETFEDPKYVSSEESTPLNMSSFRKKFSDRKDNNSFNKQNSNLTESRIIENGDKTNASQASQNETLELTENMTEATTPLNVSATELKSLKENASSSSFEKKQNKTLKPIKNNTEANSKEKTANSKERTAKSKERTAKSKERTANYKRNAFNKPYNEIQNDLNMLYRKIIQSKDFARSKGRKFDYESLYKLHSLNKIPENHILMPLYFPQLYNTEQYQSKILNNNYLQRLCELYPNYSPCFRIRMFTPGIPYGHIFGFQSQIYPSYHHHRSVPNGKVKYDFPQVPYGDYEGNMNIFSHTKNDQQRLTDFQTLGLGKKHFHFKNGQGASSLPLQNSQSMGNILISDQPKGSSLQIQEWNKGIQSKEGFDSTLLSGIINHLLSLMFPKYSGNELTAQTAILNKQDLYKKSPGQLVETNEEIDFPLGVNPPFKARFFLDTYSRDYNRPLGLKYSGDELAAQSTILDQQDLYKERPNQSAASSEEIDLPLDANPLFRTGFYPDTYYHRYNRPFDFSKTREDRKEHFMNRMLDRGESVESMNVEIEPKLSNPEYESIRISLNIPSGIEQQGVLPFVSNSKQWGFSQHETPAGSLQKRRIEEPNYRSNDIQPFDTKEDDSKMEYSSEELDEYRRNQNTTSKILPETMMVNWDIPYSDGKIDYSSEESDGLKRNENTMFKIIPEAIMVKWNENNSNGKMENSSEKLVELLNNENTTLQVLSDGMMKIWNILHDDNKMEVSSEEELDGPIQHKNITNKIRPDQFSLANGTDISEKSSFLENGGEKPSDSCTMCVYSESIYEPFNGEEKPIKTLPTIIRTLIIENDDMLIGNQSDSEKQNVSRTKRSTFYTYGSDSWCPIPRKMLYGDLDCTIWTYQKVCTIMCHPGYASNYRTFKCARRANTWNPELCACKPIKQYDGMGYRQGNDSLNEDGVNFLSDIIQNDTRNYNDASDNTRSMFGNMNIDNPETNFPSFDQTFQEGQYGSRNQIDGKNISTFDNVQNWPSDMTADRKGNSKYDSFPDFLSDGTVERKGAVDLKRNSNIGKNRDFPVIDGKEINTKLASEDEMHRVKMNFDMFEGKAAPENSFNQPYQSPGKKTEKNSQNSETIYAFFEKEGAAPGNADPW